MFTIDISNLTKQTVPVKTLAAAAVFAAKRWHLHGELSLVLAGDARLRTLNRDYRGKDKVTDILTFSAPVAAPGALGEIFINLNDCRRPQRYRDIFSDKKSFAYLLIFLLLHGLLHLAGLDDEQESERQKMVASGKKMMEELANNGII